MENPQDLPTRDPFRLSFVCAAIAGWMVISPLFAMGYAFFLLQLPALSHGNYFSKDIFILIGALATIFVLYSFQFREALIKRRPMLVFVAPLISFFVFVILALVVLMVIAMVKEFLN